MNEKYVKGSVLPAPLPGDSRYSCAEAADFSVKTLRMNSPSSSGLKLEGTIR